MASKTTFLDKIREIAVLIRIQQLGTSITAIIGALTVKGFNLEISNLLLLFIIGVIINIGGQVHNDLIDLEIDKKSKELKQRPLVKGTVSIKTAKHIILLCLITVFIFLLYFYPNIYAISIIIISFIFGTLYNLYSKKLPGADIFLSISMALFFLFGAIAVTNNFNGFQDISILTWIIFALVFIHVFLMDALGGGLKDAKNDKEAGAKTIAVYLGVNANKKFHIPLIYKLIILPFEISTIILTFSLFFIFNFEYSIIQLIIIVLLLAWMIFSSMTMLNMKEFNRKKIKYHNRNHELTAYVLVPIILTNHIGIIWALFLITIPIIWFIIFNYIFYKDSWINPKTY